LFDSAADVMTIVDPKDAAESAGLRYVSDARPGISRRKSGKGFTYIRADGSKLSEAAVLRRIKALAIPPAWADVWICPTPDGHIQATGRDAKGRKQYRYHPRFREGPQRHYRPSTTHKSGKPSGVKRLRRSPTCTSRSRLARPFRGRFISTGFLLGSSNMLRNTAAMHTSWWAMTFFIVDPRTLRIVAVIPA
jgi:Bacterial DNA topoisomerase IB, N-terminal domain